MRWRVTSFLLLFVGVFCIGCGGGGVATSTVSGTVKADGQPIPEGTISFQALDGNTPTSGAPIKDGKYTAQVPRGMQKVMVSWPEVTGTRKAYENDPNSPLIPISSKDHLPKKYQNPFETPLSVEVKSGSVTQDFDIPTKE